MEFEDILNIIKKRRIELNFTQKDIANVLNINQNSYSLIERGTQKMLASELMQIIKILELDNIISYKNNENDINYNEFIYSNKILSESLNKLVDNNSKLVDNNNKLVTINEKNSDLIIKLCNK